MTSWAFLFVTAVDSSSSYEPTALSFCNFLSILLWLSNKKKLSYRLETGRQQRISL